MGGVCGFPLLGEYTEQVSPMLPMLGRMLRNDSSSGKASHVRIAAVRGNSKKLSS